MRKLLLYILFLLFSVNFYGQFKYHVSTVNVLDLTASSCFMSNPASVISSRGSLKIADENDITLSTATGILDLTTRPAYYGVSAGSCRWIEGPNRGKIYSLGGYRMDIDPNIDSYYEHKPSFGTLYFEKVNTTQSDELNCNGVTLNATSGISDTDIIEWEYSFEGQLATISGSSNKKSIFIDFNNFPVDFENNANKIIYFRYKLVGNVFSPLKPYTILNCSPALDPNVSPNPAPINPTCSYNNDGSFTVTFDRELDDSVSEKMNLQVYRQVGSVFDGYESKVLTKSHFTGSSYTWNPKNLPGGIYKLFWQTKSNNGGFDDIGTNPDAYDESNPFTLTAPPVLSVSGTPSPVQCFGGDDGSIRVTPDGGTPPYQYSIVGSNIQPVGTLFDGLTANQYTILIKDSKGCEATSAPITVGERFPTIPEVIGLSALITNPTLINGNNGRIAISVSSGSGNYTNYAWTKDGNPFTPPLGSTNTNIINLYEGVYTIVVTDSNGCSSDVETFTLTDPEPIQVTINMTPNTVNCSDTKVNLIASATGGFLNSGGDYTYLWDDGTTEASLTNVGIGNYQVTV
ncbi:SprB repeat-containing protein, partial [Aquimarina atlantica]|uniref:SprB repeat-containing protein n=1 Tax=Aquimarina atlantica TaxID=1317122 RepID=UPI00103AC3D3